MDAPVGMAGLRYIGHALRGYSFLNGLYRAAVRLGHAMADDELVPLFILSAVFREDSPIQDWIGLPL